MFKKILYPVDLAHADFAAQLAADVERIADTCEAEVEVMTAVPGFGMAIVASYFPPEAEDKAMQEMDGRLQQFTQQAFNRAVSRKVMKGTHWKRILERAESGGFDLIVMPHCDKGAANSMLLGSCSKTVAERAHCSVLILRPENRCND